MATEVDNKPATGPVPLAWESQRARQVWSWLPAAGLEHATLQQIKNIGELPNAVAVAVMPDAHKGYGMPIGTALATEGAVVPYAVGVDIGCGMVAMELGIQLGDVSRAQLRAILEGIYARVPVGIPTKKNRNQGSFTARQNSTVLEEWENFWPYGSGYGTKAEVSALRERADRQLGTLGSGNHFVELQADGDDNLWLMLHTGSRGFGYAIGQRYYQLALQWCERYYTPLPDKELAFLSLDTDAGQDYLLDMRFAMRFAEESRRRIELAAFDAIADAHIVVDDYLTRAADWIAYPEGRRIETHHNFAAIEKHFGKTVVVHRKGAVRTTDTVGSPGGDTAAAVTIPGSMETGSYIGFGKANKLAMNTCSHGAGRRLGRKAYTREVGAVDIRAQMAANGIELVCPPDSDVLDEAGGAYKDLEDVMRWQADLVEPAVKLRPLGVVKG